MHTPILIACITLNCSALAMSEPPPSLPSTPTRPSPAAAVSRDHLVATLRALPTKRAAAGDAEHVAGLLQIQSLLADQAKAMGFEVATPRVHWKRRSHAPDSPAAMAEWRNIVFDHRGTTLPHEVIIVGAHFDAVPDCPGADDNGTGTAAVLEIARVLKDRPTRRTIRFVLFNLEEVGLVGAVQFVAAFAEQNASKSTDSKEGTAPATTPETIVGMLSLEMLGCYRDEPDSQSIPFKIPGITFPTVGNFIALAGVLSARPFIRQLDEQIRAAPLPPPPPSTADAPGVAQPVKTFVFDFSPIAPPDLLRSDHAPFLLRGHPAVMITDTANFRNPNYHQPTDTIDTLDLNRYTQTVAALAHATHALAGPEGQPDPPAANLEGLPDLTKMPAAPSEAPR